MPWGLGSTSKDILMAMTHSLSYGDSLFDWGICFAFFNSAELEDKLVPLVLFRCTWVGLRHFHSDPNWVSFEEFDVKHTKSDRVICFLMLNWLCKLKKKKKAEFLYL